MLQNNLLNPGSRKCGVENIQRQAFKNTTKAADTINTFGTIIYNPIKENFFPGLEYFRILEKYEAKLFPFLFSI